MKHFTILTHNMKNHRCMVIAGIEAETAIAARRMASQKYMAYVESGEQLVCATDAQYDEYWRRLVDATDALLIRDMMEDF